MLQTIIWNHFCTCFKVKTPWCSVDWLLSHRTGRWNSAHPVETWFLVAYIFWFKEIHKSYQKLCAKAPQLTCSRAIPQHNRSATQPSSLRTHLVWFHSQKQILCAGKRMWMVDQFPARWWLAVSCLGDITNQDGEAGWCTHRSILPQRPTSHTPNNC